MVEASNPNIANGTIQEAGGRLIIIIQWSLVGAAIILAIASAIAYLQLYCKLRKVKKSGWRYRLCIKTKSQGYIDILHAVINKEQALLLERKLENFLGTLGIKTEEVNVVLIQREEIIVSQLTGVNK